MSRWMQPIVCIFGLDPESPDVQKYAKEKFKTITTHFYKTDEKLTSILVDKKPGVLVTVGSTWKQFPKVATLPYQFRHRWLHYESMEKMEERYFYYCWFHVIFNGEEDKKSNDKESDDKKSNDKESNDKKSNDK